MTTALDQALTQIRARYGEGAIRRLSEPDPGALPAALPTGFAALDRILGIGGIPRGRITELVGVGSAGQGSLAASLAAQAQRRGGQVVYVDAFRHVDLGLLAHWGVGFEDLRVLRPSQPSLALALTRDLLAEGGADLILFDRYDPTEPAFQGMDHLLAEVTPLLGATASTLVFLTEADASRYPPGRALPYYATLRLHCQQTGWITEGLSLAGLVTRVMVIKHKLGPPTGDARLSLRMPVDA